MITLESHPQWPLAIKIYRALKQEGHICFFAGGCVRDLVLGVPPKDLDIATDAVPEKVLSLFPKTIEVGKAFGVVRVVDGGHMVEVATFRLDGNYIDGRHPDQVTYSDPKSDAERRDFTINALFFDVAEKKIIDYVGGLADIKKRLIKTVGEARQRFDEDHLRILRALRFSAQLDFEIEPQTWSAVKSRGHLIKNVSEERIRDEILKLLGASQALKGLKLFIDSGLLNILFPVLSESLDLELSIWKKLVSYRQAFPWIFFFWPLMEKLSSWDEFLETAEKVKLTRQEKKQLRIAFYFVRVRDTWRKSRLGEKIIFYATSEGNMLLHVQASLDGAWQKELDYVDEELVKRTTGGKLPLHYLTGEDVMHLAGKSRGDKLHEAYMLQLEGKLNSREEALKWLK
jgi:tRNA nucleotidyltransferase (CCA-adding enzyme)